MKKIVQLTFTRPALMGVFCMGLGLLPVPLQAASATNSWSTAGTSNTWVCPYGVTSVQVECWGGGGSGGGANDKTKIAKAGGGAGGSYVIKTNLPVTAGHAYTIIIPAVALGGWGGTNGSGVAYDGTNGAYVSFTGDSNITVTANGGAPGGGAGNGANGMGGTNNLPGLVAGTNYDLAFFGGSGCDAKTANNGGGGGAGASNLTNGVPATGQSGAGQTLGSDSLHNGGAGGNGASLNGNGGNAPAGIGGGGGGARCNSSSNSSDGGNGAPGQIVLTWTPASVLKANVADNLNLGSSWVGGLAPDATSTATWSNAVQNFSSWNLGGSVSWKGIVVQNPNGTMTIANDGNTLTLGTSGIDLSAATADLNLNCAVALGGDNTWNVTSGRTLTLGGSVSGGNNVSLPGAGTVVLSGNNTYSGNTVVGGGRLVLTGGGTLTNSANIVVAGNAVLDVSGLSVPFTLAQALSTQTLSNSATGAVINGTNNCSAGTLALVYDGANPSFIITNGGMTLSAGTVVSVTVSGAALTPGTYKLIAKATSGHAGLVAGGVPTNLTVVNGPGAGTPVLSIVGNELYLTVGGTSSIGYSGTTFTYNGTGQGPAITFSGSTGARTTNYVGTSVGYNSVNAPSGAGNYYVSNTVAGDANYFGATNVQAFTINQATLMPVVTLNNKVYDGTTAATTIATRNTTGTIYGSDAPVLTGGSVAAFASKNVGNYTGISVTGLSLTGTGSGNYQLSSSNTTAGANITVAGLTLTPGTNVKIYDGTVSATNVPAAAGLQTGDTVSGTVVVYNNASAGMGKTLSVTAYTVNDGNGGTNYSVTLNPSTGGTINAATLTPVVTLNNKVYDGTTAATTIATRNTTGTIYGSDAPVLTGGSVAVFSSKNVGNYTGISVTGLSLTGTGSGNYQLSSSNTTAGANITVAGLTLTPGTNVKIYDGTVSATNVPAAAGLKTGDTVSGTVVVYNNASAGMGKTLSVTAYTVNDGNGGTNYSVTLNPSTGGTINAATLTPVVTLNNKVYDGTTAATTIATRNTTGTIYGSDAPVLTGGSVAAFASKNVGNYTGISVTGLSLTGTGSGNYQLSSSNTTAGANITVAGLTLTPGTNVKIYDGTVSATNVPAAAGLQTGDTVSGTAVVYDTATVGSGKTLSVSAYTVNDGNGGNNYSVTLNTSTGGTIYQATPTATLTVTNSPVFYTGRPQAAAVTILSSSVPGTLQNILTGGAASQTAVGTNAVTANFVPTDSTDYLTLSNVPAGNFSILATNVMPSIGVATYSSVADSTNVNQNLATAGLQDWQLFGGSSMNQPSVVLRNGGSILVAPPVIVAPCNQDNFRRSSQTFTWTNGTPDYAETNQNFYDSGFGYGSSGTNAFGMNYETYTFVPGDVLPHTIHLYGYIANSSSGITFLFSNILSGAMSTVVTTNPPLGDFDYSLTFQASSPTNALTVVWTFQKTGTTSAGKYMGINAAVITGTPPPTTAMNWRVIADDTNFPTSDTVLAGVVAGDVIDGMYTLPTDTTNNDCSVYFQAAMNWLSLMGGGTVFVPPGHYKFTNGLTMPDGVTLRGRWVQPGPGQPVNNCTIFDVYFNSNVPPVLESIDTNAFIISPNTDCGLRDLTFWYPNQNPTNPVPYPYTICNPANMKTIENITLVNSYAGVDMKESGFACLRGIYGTTLEMGVRMDDGQAVPRVELLNLAPDYWSWSGLPGAPTNAATKAILAGLMLNNTNCVGLEAENVDDYFAQNIVISGYDYGVRLTKNGDNPGQPEFFNVVATNCTEALRLASTKSLQAINCTFGGTTNGYGVHRLGQAAGDYTGCTIYGGAGAVYCDAGGTAFNLNLEGCTLNNSITISNSNYELDLVGSSFISTGTNVVLYTGGHNPAQVVIAGNSNCGPANVANYLGTSDHLVISTNPVAPVTVPNFPIDYPRTRKPAQTNLFDVFAFGARGDGVTDDTAAVQAAIAAATANQGGIVFFPAGTFLLTQPLSVSNGVELRGIFGGRHENAAAANIYGSGKTGSQLNLNPATTNGPAFITLNGQSGMRGLNLDYPNQNGQSLAAETPYPYMIQCSGGSNYLVDICCGSDYQGVDMNGAKAALVDYCFFGGLQNIFMVRGGSTDCRIQNVHAKPGSWWDSGKGPSDSIISAQENTFIAQDCTNLTISSIFNHAAHTMFTQRGGTGQVLLMNGEVLQRAYVMESAPANGALNFMACNALVYGVGDGTGNYEWWLQSNYVGTVSVMSSTLADLWVNYILRVDNTNACLIMNDPFLNSQQQLPPTIRAAGKVVINNACLNNNFTVDVPALGQLVISNSVLNDMPYAPQAGYQNWNNNCIVSGNSFIAANLGDTPVVTNGISLITNNLGNVQVGLGYGWQLLNGNSNFLFHVTSPYFTNGLMTNVTISLSMTVVSNGPANGSITVSYDSLQGLTNAGNFTLNPTNAGYVSTSFQVTNARFANTNGTDIIVTYNGGQAYPYMEFVAVHATTNLGVPPSGGQPHVLLGPPPVVITTVPPQFAGARLDGKNVILTGFGGPTGGNAYYWVLSATNLSLPLKQWECMATNRFNWDGSFSNMLPATPGTPQRFYRLQTQ